MSKQTLSVSDIRKQVKDGALERMTADQRRKEVLRLLDTLAEYQATLDREHDATMRLKSERDELQATLEYANRELERHVALYQSLEAYVKDTTAQTLASAYEPPKAWTALPRN